MNKVTVYSKPENCVQCNATKRWLDANKVPYVDADVSEHMEMLESTGIRQLPIVEFNGGFFGGFDIGKLGGIKKAIAE